MARYTSSQVGILSMLLLQSTAQLLSCSDVGCPTDSGWTRCNIDNTTLTRIGVANFSSSLSPDPLTWTIGFAPESFTDTTDQKRYYLGTPQGVDFNGRTDISGCALFFTGIEAGLRFTKPNETSVFLDAISGTCADALGSVCESELIQQAQNLAAQSTSSGGLQCLELALGLQSTPPVSCTEAGTWGNITAKSIVGPDTPSILRLNGCNPTIDKSYDVRSVVTFPKIGARAFANDVTPLMTILATTGNGTEVLRSPEVHLNCMKLMENEMPNEVVAGGSGRTLTVRESLPSMVAAFFACLVMTAFMA